MNNVIFQAKNSFEFSDWPDGDIGFVLKNNIFYAPSEFHIYHSPKIGEQYHNLVMDDNLYFPEAQYKFINNVFSIFQDWKINTGLSANSFVADPKFITASSRANAIDFKISQDSPAINYGNDVCGDKDFVGTNLPIGDKVDLGAFEFIAGDSSSGD